MPQKIDADGKPKRVPVMMPPSLLRQIDGWRGREDDVPNRAEAIRRLLQWSLETMKKGSKQR